jgi:hypothetical protein
MLDLSSFSPYVALVFFFGKGEDSASASIDAYNDAYNLLLFYSTRVLYI